MPPLAAAVAAAAAAIGVSAGALSAFLVGLALQAVSMGMQALLRAKPSKGSISGRRDQMQSTVRDPVKARELVLGRVRKGGTILFWETVDNESDFLMLVAFAGHQVTAIDEIYFFDELAISQTGVVQPKFQGHLEFEKFLGAADQPASTLLRNSIPRWTENHPCRGIAYVVLKLEFNRDIFNQAPNVSAVIRGAPVFDPRDGLMKYTTNAALNFAHYLSVNAFCGLGAEYGTDIDEDMLVTSANESDEDVPIKAGHVLEFNGDDFINMGNVLNQTGAVSIEARIMIPDFDHPGMRVLDKLTDFSVQGFTLSIEPPGIVRFVTAGVSTPGLDTGAVLVANQWHKIAGVWDPTNGVKKIYVDGVVQAQASGLAGAIEENGSSLRIGDNFFGRIQDVRLWAEARSGTAILHFSDKTLTGQEENLVGYWKLDEKQGDRAEDATETPNDGAITGAVWVEEDAVIGTEKRFPLNGVVFSDALPREIIEELLTAMAGSAIFSGGKWLIRAAAYEAPTVLLDEDDAIDALRIQPRRSKRDLFNAIRGTFLAPENQYQPADFPLITVPGFETQDGGQQIVQDIELPFTTSASAAQRIAFLHLLRNREQVSCVYKAKFKGLRLRAGDFCEVTNTRLGWSGKDFEVMNWELAQIEDRAGNPGFGVVLDLRETNPIIYDFNPATDEVPLNPSPDTNLPSPFGPIAIITDFVDRTGFESISEEPNHPHWPGTYAGFVRNPWTGHLNVEDRADNGDDDFDTFDNYVTNPVPLAYYESPEIDIDFSDIVRTFMIAQFFKGPGENDRITVKRFFDVTTALDAGFAPGFDPESFPVAGESADAYGGWRRLERTTKAEGRFFKHKMEFDFHSGSGGYLAAFTPVIDKMTNYQKGMGLIVPPGGKEIVFEERYHNIPSMSSSVQNGLRFVDFTEISTTGFEVLMFDRNADDVGGVMDWQAAGA